MGTLTDREMLVRYWEYTQLTEVDFYGDACAAFEKRWGHDPEVTGEVVVRETRELVLQIQVEAAGLDTLAALRGLLDSPIVVESSDQGELHRLLERARVAVAKAEGKP